MKNLSSANRMLILSFLLYHSARVFCPSSAPPGSVAQS